MATIHKIFSKSGQDWFRFHTSCTSDWSIITGNWSLSIQTHIYNWQWLWSETFRFSFVWMLLLLFHLLLLLHRNCTKTFHLHNVLGFWWIPVEPSLFSLSHRWYFCLYYFISVTIILTGADRFPVEQQTSLGFGSEIMWILLGDIYYIDLSLLDFSSLYVATFILYLVHLYHCFVTAINIVTFNVLINNNQSDALENYLKQEIVINLFN